MKTGDNKTPFYFLLGGFALFVLVQVLVFFIGANFRLGNATGAVKQVLGIILVGGVFLFFSAAGAYLYQSLRLRSLKPINNFPNKSQDIKYFVSTVCAGLSFFLVFAGIYAHIYEVSKEEELKMFSIALITGVVAIGIFVWEIIQDNLLSEDFPKTTEKKKNDPLGLYEDTKRSGEDGKGKIPRV